MKTSMSIKIDKDVRDKAKDIFGAIGIDMTTAVNMFFKATIRENGIPFPVAAVPLGVNVEQVEKQWAQKLKRAEEQESANQMRDFYGFAAELKKDYGIK
jgi:DNA-damage-inducible protein J